MADHSTGEDNKVDISLGHVTRHCLLHALVVIEAAISQVRTYVQKSTCVYCVHTYVRMYCLFGCVYVSLVHA